MIIKSKTNILQNDHTLVSGTLYHDKDEYIQMAQCLQTSENIINVNLKLHQNYY